MKDRNVSEIVFRIKLQICEKQTYFSCFTMILGYIISSLVQPCYWCVSIHHLFNPATGVYLFITCSTLLLVCMYSSLVQPCYRCVSIHHLFNSATGVYLFITCSTLLLVCIYSSLVQPCYWCVSIHHLFNPATGVYLFITCSTLLLVCIYSSLVQHCYRCVSIHHLFNTGVYLFICCSEACNTTLSLHLALAKLRLRYSSLRRGEAPFSVSHYLRSSELLARWTPAVAAHPPFRGTLCQLLHNLDFIFCCNWKHILSGDEKSLGWSAKSGQGVLKQEL
ncbi:hypothetical protein FHG87_018268 [Trinorchestia longiramus]|nr:hypothetical protein FHG87_018268 [Trinorchestia longiramus]